VTLKQVRRIMKKAGLRALYAGKKTSISVKGHARYPYLLRGKDIWLPNQVWATDMSGVNLFRHPRVSLFRQGTSR
jgi:putative transposase